MEFIFHTEVISNRRHLSTICVANSTIFRLTLDTASGKSQDNEAIEVSKGRARSKSEFCFCTLESTGLGPFPVGQVHAGSWSN